MPNQIIKYLGYLLKAKSAHGIHSPFVYRFIHELIDKKNADYYQFKELNALRKSLLKNNAIITITDFGAGSRIFKDNKRKISNIARHGVSKKKFSELYFKLVNFCHAKYIVELGTSLGLNTLYLAKANSKSLICTVEGCSELADFAKSLFEKEKTDNIRIINETFEKALPKVLEEIPHVDLLYIDGNHKYQPTLTYFELALQKKQNNSVFILDDINWSDEMQMAWQKIKSHPDVTLSIDLFSVGIVFFRKEQKEKEHFVLRY